MRRILVILALGSCALWAGSREAPLAELLKKASVGKKIAFDAMEKEWRSTPPEDSHAFRFQLRNIDAEELIIHDVVATCSCTAIMPQEKPWKVAPGATTEIVATLNFQGKTGRITKPIIVRTSAGEATLRVSVTVPDRAPSDR